MSSFVLSPSERNNQEISKDSDSLEDEIGEESIQDMNESDSSNNRNSSNIESPVPKFSSKLDLPRLKTNVCKSARLDESEPEQKTNFLHCPTNNFQRRGTVFEIGGFGSTQFMSHSKSTKPTMLHGDLRSK